MNYDESLAAAVARWPGHLRYRNPLGIGSKILPQVVFVEAVASPQSRLECVEHAAHDLDVLL
jgi:hypothetical protein